MFKLILIIYLLSLFIAPEVVFGGESTKKYNHTKSTYIPTGIASWYSIKSNGGRHTASGIPLDNNKLTAAHKTLPMGTKVRVTNLDNQKSVVVTINDRGPYKRGRIIDLTQGAFKKLGALKKGLLRVKIKPL